MSARQRPALRANCPRLEEAPARAGRAETCEHAPGKSAELTEKVIKRRETGCNTSASPGLVLPTTAVQNRVCPIEDASSTAHLALVGRQIEVEALRGNDEEEDAEWRLLRELRGLGLDVVTAVLQAQGAPYIYSASGGQSACRCGRGACL